MSPREAKSADEPMEFETALARLEALVKEMESGNLSLDRMMACFEEGTRLAKRCDQKLNEVEQKIEKLVKQGEHTATEPFEPSKEG